MADSKITELTELTSINDADLIPIVDASEIPTTTKKITASNLVKNDSDVSANTSHRSLTNNPHAVTATQISLGNVNDTSDADKPVSTATQTALDLKYNATNPNNYETDTELDSRDTANRIRSNHSGTQLSNTISDFASTVIGSVLTGISFAVSTAVVASDSILIGIGKLQAQINAINFSKVIFYDYIPGLTANPETTATTSGTAPVLDEMTKTFIPDSASTLIEVYFSGTFGENATTKDETVHVAIFIDGTIEAESERSISVKGIGDNDKISSVATQWLGTLSDSIHTIDVRFWIKGDGGATARGIINCRSLIVKEIEP